MNPETEKKQGPTAHSKIDLEILKDYARILYSRQHFTHRQVSQQIGVHINTVQRWSADGAWKKRPQSFKVICKEQIAIMQEELAELDASIHADLHSTGIEDLEKTHLRRQMVSHISELKKEVTLKKKVSPEQAIINAKALADWTAYLNELQNATSVQAN